jgi:hypothetical protein
VVAEKREGIKIEGIGNTNLLTVRLEYQPYPRSTNLKRHLKLIDYLSP